MASKPTSESYFIKRLRDSGYLIDRVPVRFGQHDSRSWMVVIDPGGAAIFATAFLAAVFLICAIGLFFAIVSLLR